MKQGTYTWKWMKHKEHIKTGSKVLQLYILNIYYILNQVYRGVFFQIVKCTHLKFTVCWVDKCVCLIIIANKIYNIYMPPISSIVCFCNQHLCSHTTPDYHWYAFFHFTFACYRGSCQYNASNIWEFQLVHILAKTWQSPFTNDKRFWLRFVLIGHLSFCWSLLKSFALLKILLVFFLELYEILHIPNKKCQIYTLCVYTCFYIVFIWYLLWVCKLKGQRTLIFIKHGFLLCLVWEVFISSSWRFFLNCFPSVPYIYF